MCFAEDSPQSRMPDRSMDRFLAARPCLCRHCTRFLCPSVCSSFRNPFFFVPLSTYMPRFLLLPPDAGVGDGGRHRHLASTEPKGGQGGDGAEPSSRKRKRTPRRSWVVHSHRRRLVRTKHWRKDSMVWTTAASPTTTTETL